MNIYDFLTTYLVILIKGTWFIYFLGKKFSYQNCPIYQSRINFSLYLEKLKTLNKVCKSR